MTKAFGALKSERGTALLTGLMVMMMVAVFGCAYITLTSSNLLRANRDLRRATAFYLAEAGLEYTVGQLIAQAEANGGNMTSQTIDTTSVLATLHTGATGTVWVTVRGSYATVVSSAEYRDITETVRVLVKGKNIGIWNNAIFAGIGQSGRGINGNVDIRGSVHILGEGDPFSDLNGNGVRDAGEPFNDSNGNGIYEPALGETFTDSDGNGVWTQPEPYQDNNVNGMYDPPLTATELATDFSGSANIGNNYTGMPASLQAKIPGLPLQSIGGEWVQSLQSEVRVKHGTVNISGSANIGDPNVSGNNIKETVDGVYVSDGWGGNQGATNVYSDNGVAQSYDLGDRIGFPSLSDPYTDPSTGMTYGSHEAYLDANSLTVNISAIDDSTASFSFSDGVGNSISWDQSTSTLALEGIVRVNGDLDICSKKSSVYFDGRGTIFSKGTVRVHGSVMPKSTFPTADVIGCIAKYDIEFATGGGEAQLEACGAWYAQRKIISAKQNQFAGTYVSNYFDMGTNVPSIYQVPSLSDNLPPGMPGGEQIFVIQTLSWKHVRPSI